MATATSSIDTPRTARVPGITPIGCQHGLMADMVTKSSASTLKKQAPKTQPAKPPSPKTQMARTQTARTQAPKKQSRRRKRPDDAVAPRPTALVGIALAIWSALLGIAVLVCLMLAAWVSAAHHDNAIRPAIATALQAWLLAQHSAIGLGSGGSFSLAPLGLTVALAAILARGGRLTAKFSGASDALDATTSALALALPYAVVAALLTAPARDGGSHPSPLGALAGSFVLALACAIFGALREIDQIHAVIGKFPDAVRAVVRAGLAASAIVVGSAAIVYLLALGAHAERAGALASSVHGGYAGVVLLAVISTAYAPNAVVWTSSYSLGPGFAVGAHTSVSLAGSHLGAAPAFPLLAPLPGDGAPPAYAWLVIVGPLAAGIAAGWLLARREIPCPDAETPWWERYRLAAAARGLAGGLVAGVVLAALAALSAGSLGGGRMSVLGPSAWWVLAFGAAEIGLVAAATIWLRGWVELRGRPGVVRLDREVSLP